jgi:hypothetical protein
MARILASTQYENLKALFYIMYLVPSNDITPNVADKGIFFRTSPNSSSYTFHPITIGLKAHIQAHFEATLRRKGLI